MPDPELVPVVEPELVPDDVVLEFELVTGLVTLVRLPVLLCSVVVVVELSPVVVAEPVPVVVVVVV